MQFHRIKANLLGRARCRGKGIDCVGNIHLSHRLAAGHSRRRPFCVSVWIRARARLARQSLMPQLRCNPTALSVNGRNHSAPSLQTFRVMEVRNAGLVRRRLAIDCGAFRYDQPHAPFGATTVIVRHSRARNPIRAQLARHRGHHDPVLQLQAIQGQWAEQDIRAQGKAVVHFTSPKFSEGPIGVVP